MSVDGLEPWQRKLLQLEAEANSKVSSERAKKESSASSDALL